MRDQLVRGELPAGFRLPVESLALLALPLRGRRIHRQDEIPPRFVSGPADRLQDMRDRFLVTPEIRREAALVTDGSRPAFLLQQLRERVKDLGRPAESFSEIRRPDRHDHKLLGVDGIGRVRPAVQNIHHRNRENDRARAAEIAVQRKVQRRRRRSGRSNGYRENRVGPEIGFILRPVQFHHRPVRPVEIGHIRSGKSRRDDAVDVPDSLRDTFSPEPCRIAVPQLQRLEFPGRSAGGRSAPSDGSVRQRHLRLNRRIAPRVDDLSSVYLHNLKIFPHPVLLSVSLNLHAAFIPASETGPS